MKRFNINTILKELLPWFMILYLISFILTSCFLLTIGYIMNEKYGYYPLPPFYFVFFISFIISLFLFIPWTEASKHKIRMAFSAAYAPSSEKESGNVGNSPEIISTLEKFISSVIQFLKQNGISTDIYCRIILNLIIAGAAEEMTSFFSLSENEHKRILHFALKTIAVQIPLNRKEPKSFYIALNSPELASAHRVLIDFGAASMAKVLTGRRNNIFFGFLDIVYAWRKAVIPELSVQDEDRLENHFAVLMFTDITGYSYGASIPQSAIETHNLIVRQALKLFGGEEVRTLDKGIFASFVDESKAISAAIFIQQKICSFNLEHPTEIFFTRIGIHSGDVILEGNDLIGTTVKYAAFICSRARASSIFVSQRVYDKTFASGLFTFENEGNFAPESSRNTGNIYNISYDKWQSNLINE